MIKTQFRSKFYKNVNDAMTDYGNYQMQLNHKGSKYFHYCAEGVRIIKSYKPLMKRLGVMFGTINNKYKELN